MVGDDHRPSFLPALLGMVSLERMRTILDMVNRRIHFLGPGDFEIGISMEMPAGTKTYRLEKAPSGHYLLPCSCFDKINTTKRHIDLATMIDTNPDQKNIESGRTPANQQ